MENTYPPLQAVGRVGNVAYRITDLPAMFGMTLARLPVVLRLELEPPRCWSRRTDSMHA
ncbi:hypothetical protein Q2T91_00670 [Ralstonia pseudosolanacearum]|uniref:Uncharacterized protein n=1 Tax=Ralstonia solanacearum TaxID=305 RepID=A0A0S4X1J6_RALSL|nr:MULTISPECIES: hypothetical protein [Ralstonia]UZF18312.1 hypothetical protein LH706_21570 [Ralstonia solanacearum]UZF33448.1 hypothetical protein LGV82_19690 [Ralstonia sp. RS650]CUV57733.1 protein of unknown function [Ralstonia solanacearum]